MKKRFVAYALAAAWLLLTFAGCTTAPTGGGRLSDHLLVIAHRGGVVEEGVPENSLLGLELAIERGYTHLEVDVRHTRDGHLVCFHDPEVRLRDGAMRAISDLSLAELQEIPLNGTDERVPTFDAYCARAAGRINLMIDVKGVSDAFIESYAAGIEATLRQHGLLAEALLLINREPIRNQDKVAERLHGKIRVSWREPLATARASERAQGDPGKYYYIFNHGADFTQAEVDGFHAMGLLVIVSINLGHYLDDPLQQGLSDLRRVLSYGVDGVQIDSVYDPVIFNK
jgi:glycerophosphoryl diester phosphodiesterase